MVSEIGGFVPAAGELAGWWLCGTIDEAVKFGPCLEALRISKKDLQNEADKAASTLTLDSVQPLKIMKLV
jgi:hypothetical protein